MARGGHARHRMPRPPARDKPRLGPNGRAARTARPAERTAGEARKGRADCVYAFADEIASVLA